jgi:hypothetical protein
MDMSTDSRLPYVHLINKCVALSSIQEAKDRCRYTRLYSQTMLNNQLLRVLLPFTDSDYPFGIFKLFLIRFFFSDKVVIAYVKDNRVIVGCLTLSDYIV